MSSLVISLDFELFWGVADSRTVAGYRSNVEGVWVAIPKMLTLFQRYGVRVTWATVGMLMCRNHSQWREIRPSIMPCYVRQECSTYALDAVAREYPKLFFARPLVEQILSTPGQELATHTYSHFFCDEEGATPEQFTADLVCARHVASDMGVDYRSLVFPRNQVRPEYVEVLANSGIQVYRGNQDHWLYRNGHYAPCGLAGRAVRLADSYLTLTGIQITQPYTSNDLTNLPASHFFRPWSHRLAMLEPLHLTRLKRAMTEAARSDSVCHLWWHPHNFGVNVEQNLAALESLLQHYLVLKDQYGLQSVCMRDCAPSASA
jgi:hypothetical protein